MIKVNDICILPTIFPDGTSQIWKIDNEIFNQWNITITWIFENEAELFHLAQLMTLLKRNESSGYIDLYMPYMPYARQDKRISNQTTFALQTFAKTINSMKFRKVSSLDVHNPIVSCDLIRNLECIKPFREIDRCRIAIGHIDFICYPDGSAKKRLTGNWFYMEDFSCIKHRNSSTGEIQVIGIDKDMILSGSTILIVDDICDGGMTFIKAAELLYRKEAKNVHLYISHGLFTKGKQVLRDAGIKRIFTKDGEVS